MSNTGGDRVPDGQYLLPNEDTCCRNGLHLIQLLTKGKVSLLLSGSYGQSERCCSHQSMCDTTLSLGLILLKIFSTFTMTFFSYANNLEVISFHGFPKIYSIHMFFYWHLLDNPVSLLFFLSLILFSMSHILLMRHFINVFNWLIAFFFHYQHRFSLDFH